MTFILIWFLVLIVSIIIFFVLNTVLKKNIENYGIYCGLYNTSPTPKLSCNNDSECMWNSNLAYCTNKPSTYVAPQSIFGTLSSDFNNLENIIKSGPQGIDNALVNLGNEFQRNVSNDVNIISKNANSLLKNFDNTIFSKKGAPISEEE